MPRLSSRRFKQIMGPLASKSQLPWASLDFKNINTETYLALITRDGELSIMEPKDHDMLSSEWTEWTRFSVCGTPPSRMNEASFKVCFHREKVPCWEAVAAGLDYKALSLAVAAMETVKIYRTDRDRKLYLAAELTGARDLVRDVAWANGSMRGYDVLATASKDGLVRIYELRTPPGTDDRPASQRLKSAMQDVERPSTNSTTRESGISAGFASAARMQIVQEEDEEAPGRVRQVAKLVSVLDGHQGKGGVWRVVFSHAGTTTVDVVGEIANTPSGDLLVTTGDDGAVRSYKKAVSGKWLEYAQIDADDLADAES